MFQANELLIFWLVYFKRISQRQRIKMKTQKKFNTVITLHYFRLIYRSILFVLLAITYVRYRLFSAATVIESAEKMPAIIYFTHEIRQHGHRHL